MEKFSRESEDRLVSVLRDVTHLVHQGDHPTDAIVKVARQEQLPASCLPLVVQGYNVGRAAHQREKAAGQGILDRLAPFDLARIEDVKEALYPSAPEAPVKQASRTAVAECYAKPASMTAGATLLDYGREKTAELLRVPEPVKPTKPADVYSQAEKAAQALELARAAAMNGRDAMLGSLTKLADYFRSYPTGRLSFDEVAYNASRVFGKAAEAALTYCCHTLPDLVKEAAVFTPPGQPVFEDREPYSLVKAALDAGQQAIKCAGDLASAKEVLAAANAALPYKQANDGQLWQALAGIGGWGAAAGVTPGALLGLGAGAEWGRPGVGLLRGATRGAATGGGAALGSVAGTALAQLLGAGPGASDLATLAGAGAGGVAGYQGSGALLGEPRREAHKSAGLAEMTRTLTHGAPDAPQLKPVSELVAGKTRELDDPSHLNEIHRIRTQAMLTDLMANDEVPLQSKCSLSWPSSHGACVVRPPHGPALHRDRLRLLPMVRSNNHGLERRVRILVRFCTF
jgi:hypothetical protein